MREKKEINEEIVWEHNKSAEREKDVG